MVERGIAKVSIAGAGMIGRPGIAAQMFKTLASSGVNIQMISTSEVKVSCVIDAEDGDKAIAALCQTFDINSSPVQQALMRKSKETDQALTHPQSPVRGVALDLNQARLAIRYVPDHPGMAAQLFGLLADQNISVDMIIQSQRCRVMNGVPTRDIAFTVSQADAQAAQTTLQQAMSVLGCGEILLDLNIAKVSIVGAGMVGQPGVAAQMFEALAQHQINIQMITTSEIKISCVVAKEDGVMALQAIHKAFGLAGSQKIEVPA
jgi:aspartate kinase